MIGIKGFKLRKSDGDLVEVDLWKPDGDECSEQMHSITIDGCESDGVTPDGARRIARMLVKLADLADSDHVGFRVVGNERIGGHRVYAGGAEMVTRRRDLAQMYISRSAALKERNRWRNMNEDCTNSYMGIRILRVKKPRAPNVAG